MQTQVVITHAARKALTKVPDHVQDKFLFWVSQVTQNGLAMVRQVPAFHDEPLKGQRKGQRSVRLSRQWRAIYTVTEAHTVVVTVLEVTAHDYRTR